MAHFCHSDIIPSFKDEDEWDDVDHFPYREVVIKKGPFFVVFDYEGGTGGSAEM